MSKLVKLSYTNMVNNNLFNILNKVNLNVSRNEYNQLYNNNLDYIVNYFVNENISDYRYRNLLIKKIDYKLLYNTQDYNVNPILINKNNMELNKLENKNIYIKKFKDFNESN